MALNLDAEKKPNFTFLTLKLNNNKNKCHFC